MISFASCRYEYGRTVCDGTRVSAVTPSLLHHIITCPKVGHFVVVFLHRPSVNAALHLWHCGRRELTD